MVRSFHKLRPSRVLRSIQQVISSSSGTERSLCENRGHRPVTDFEFLEDVVSESWRTKIARSPTDGHLFQMEQRRRQLIEQHQLAGAGGIEPPNGGIKIRCLTAWLRPNRRPGAGGRTGYRRFPWSQPVYRERRSISTAWRGKIPQPRDRPRYTLFMGPRRPRSDRHRPAPPAPLRPPPFHGNRAPRPVHGSEP